MMLTMACQAVTSSGGLPVHSQVTVSRHIGQVAASETVVDPVQQMSFRVKGPAIAPVGKYHIHLNIACKWGSIAA